jgi:L-alanine-DL-glutamate epimerase-like enolase superfamily enzyme
MKITGLTVHIFEERPEPIQETKKWHGSAPYQDGVAMFHTDEGIDGIVATHGDMLHRIVSLWPIAREHIEGQNPLDRERIENILARQFRWSQRVIGVLDNGLWDIAGKYFKQPIYKLLGAARDKILAYGSTVHHDTDEKFIETALQCKEHGFKAIKLHPYDVADDDIRLCYKVRKAVGDEMKLMLDPKMYPGPYNRVDAMRVGRVLDELNFWWYEDPLDKRDLEGFAELKRNLEVQIRMHDSTEDFREYAAIIQKNCADIIAGHSAFGITTAMKVAHLAEIHNLGFEIHNFHGGTASLHVGLAAANTGFYEKAVPLGSLFENSYPGVYLDVPQVDKEGYVHAPVKPGLGFEVDFSEVKKITAKTINV